MAVQMGALTFDNKQFAFVKTSCYPNYTVSEALQNC